MRPLAPHDLLMVASHVFLRQPVQLQPSTMHPPPGTSPDCRSGLGSMTMVEDEDVDGG